MTISLKFEVTSFNQITNESQREAYVKLYSVLCFAVGTPKKYNLDFYGRNSTAKVKLIFFK